MKFPYIIILCCIAFLLFCFWLSLINEGSNSLNAIYLKSIVGPIFISIFLIASEISTPTEVEIQKVKVGVPRFGSTHLCSALLGVGSSHTQGAKLLSDMDWEWDTNLIPKLHTFSAPHLHMNYIIDLYFDKFEVTFWNWMDVTYGGHWQVEFDHSVMLSGNAIGGHPVSDAEKKPRKVTREDIIYLLQQNRALAIAPKLLKVNFLGFPNGTTIRITRTESTKTIVFKTKNIVFEILITGKGSEVLGGGDLAHKYRRKTNQASAEIDYFDVTFKIQVRNLRRWSHTTRLHKKWAEQFINKFRHDFDWELIRNEIQEKF